MDKNIEKNRVSRDIEVVNYSEYQDEVRDWINKVHPQNGLFKVYWKSVCKIRN